MTMILLKSVGTFVNTKTGMTHPALLKTAVNHKPDLYGGSAVHIGDTTEEWMNSLSSEDIEILKKERVKRI